MMPVKIMDIPYDAEGIFVRRNNRFLSTVEVDGERVRVHVRDPGRLEELLFPENDVLLARADKSGRKTSWDLIAANYDRRWVLVNSGFHRKIAFRVLTNPKLSPSTTTDGWKAEKRLGESRIDFLNDGEVKIWLEVKGCTFAIDGKALFPDAPTTRGTRHVRELIGAVEGGDRGVLLILIFRQDAECFSPYEDRDPDFARAFLDALDVGVEVYPLKFIYKEHSLFFQGQIPIC